MWLDHILFLDFQELKNLSEKFLKYYYEAYTSEEDFLSKADASLIREINNEMQSNPNNKDNNKKNENVDDMATTPPQQPNNKEIVDDRLSSMFAFSFIAIKLMYTLNKFFFHRLFRVL